MFYRVTGGLGILPRIPLFIFNKNCFRFYLGRNRCISNIAKSTEFEYPKKRKGWYEYWEKNGLFCAQETIDSEKQSQKPEFCLVLPPPNVTGNLHIGHTLTVTIQDCISRWRRMKGENVNWIPGFDHGERFLTEINQWKTVTQNNIEMQLKILGASLDFQKSSFTLDKNTSKAVSNVFIKLFDENLIYRKEKLVNWSGHIRSVISDIEVDHLEIPEKRKFVYQI
ncbi:valine--tRNA ligase, mitochondrial 1 [Caerostris extrusa]|uniref:valine--tRNA ligase n=1 Tax=Caerostris extrusa TaxID=172846 RepID=A0AAV4WMR0_CAEEX|nr:valine--tRNA ligase, mitochondrial 1 [Caerostris extrusa]